MTTSDDVTDQLVELLDRPAWHRDALCLEYPDVNFFPAQDDRAGRAQAVCRRCLVQSTCLGYALETGTTHGVWGGTTARGRRALVAADQVRRCTVPGCDQVIARSTGSKCQGHTHMCVTAGCTADKLTGQSRCGPCRSAYLQERRNAA